LLEHQIINKGIWVGYIEGCLSEKGIWGIRVEGWDRYCYTVLKMPYHFMINYDTNLLTMYLLWNLKLESEFKYHQKLSLYFIW
jgi:hypothetical protein